MTTTTTTTTIIRISERGDSGSGQALLSIVRPDQTDDFPVTLAGPFAPAEEERLAWYFERYLAFPFVESVKVETAAASIRAYGEALFRQLFDNQPRAFAQYRAALEQGLPTLRFEIVGSPTFHRRHWEALHDPELPRSFVLETQMVRRVPRPQAILKHARTGMQMRAHRLAYPPGYTPDDPDDHEDSAFLRMQPTLPYFLRTRLSAPDQVPVRAAIETAFHDVYRQVGRALDDLLSSNEPGERQLGQALARREEANLVSALLLAVRDQVPFYADVLSPLRHSLSQRREHARLLTIAQSVLDATAAYSETTLAGDLGFDVAGVLDTIAREHLELKQHAEAATAYRRALDLLLATTSLDESARRRQSASLYHQLGSVAQQQRQWEQAERSLQQALALKIEFGDRYSQASIYGQLGRVAQELRQWEQAERCYQQALAIYVEFGERYEQAGTYHQLGRVAEEEQQWVRVRDCFLHALDIYVSSDDAYNSGIAFRSLRRLWQAIHDPFLLTATAFVLHTTEAEVTQLFTESSSDTDPE